MLFNSYDFIFLFLPVALAGCYALVAFHRARLAVWWVGLASLAFYAIGEIEFLHILVGSVLFNYVVGGRIIAATGTTAGGRWLFAGVAANLALLAVFKYTGFFITAAADASGIAVPIPAIALPVGISFYTFTQIAYLVDCRRGMRENHRFGDYLLFVTFFPHLVAGPILNHRRVIPQLGLRRFGRPGARRLMAAWIFFSLGLFKKVLIADTLSPYVVRLFDNAHALTLLEAWAAALLYGFQLYYDFSGYSEMAVGLALMLGVRIPINFDAPYRASSIISFWRRWHISLSNFLRDYLYIPLGGNRKGGGRRYVNLILTMLLGGAWHGAGWTFILWGAIHGAALAANHLWRRTGLRLPAVLGWLLTFLVVMMAWVPFRAADFAAAKDIWSSMLGLKGVAVVASLPHLPDAGQVAVALVALAIWTHVGPTTRSFALGRGAPVLRPAAAAVLFAVSVLGLARVSEFLYFIF